MIYGIDSFYGNVINCYCQHLIYEVHFLCRKSKDKICSFHSDCWRRSSIGVELAGEIASDFSDMKVTLVHKGPGLLEYIGEKAVDKTLKWLKSKNVEVKLDQAVNLNGATDGHHKISRTG